VGTLLNALWDMADTARAYCRPLVTMATAWRRRSWRRWWRRLSPG